METNDNGRWANERLSIIEPSWTPNLMRARASLERRLASQPRRRLLVAAAALAGLAVAILAIPPGRAIAQELWFRLFLNRIDVLRVDLSDAPFQTRLMGSGQRVVADLDEAQARAGLRPLLPDAGSWPGTPQISVIGAMTIEHTVRTRELRSALARVGATDVVVPDEWDQLTMRANIGPIVAAHYPGEVVILQSRPVHLFVPSGFPFAQFAETAFRSLGLNWWEARALARRYVAQPSLLLGIPADEPARIEDVSLRSGPGLLVEEFKDDGGVVRVTLMFGIKDAIYSVISPSRELCLKLADLLH